MRGVLPLGVVKLLNMLKTRYPKLEKGVKAYVINYNIKE